MFILFEKLTNFVRLFSVVKNKQKYPFNWDSSTRKDVQLRPLGDGLDPNY